MPQARKPLWTRASGVATAILAGLWLAAPAPAFEAGAESALARMRPDYRAYVGHIRPLARDGGAAAALYMALVRPGAADPSRRENAPFIGPGARNDILYDPALFPAGTRTAWVMLLLDHEYFHARHLAGATSLPVPSRAPAEVEKHYCEAAAWGFNVAQARSGLYPGLSEAEFREALDRYGEHYRALRALTEDASGQAWEDLAARLRDPVSLITRTGSPGPAAPARPSGPDRSSAIP